MTTTKHEADESGRRLPDLLTPHDVARDYTIPESTQAVWRCTNRYGFRDMAIKFGRSVRYKRADMDRWVESRRVVDGVNA